MGFKSGDGVVRWGLPTGGLVLLSLMFALGVLAGQARAAVPLGLGDSFPNSASMSTQTLQPNGNGPMYAKLNIRIVTGKGSITWSPPGIKNFRPEDCPDFHSEASTVECYFERGTTVTFTATPDSGYELYRWEGECDGTGTCQVTIDTEGYVMARFTPEGEGGPGGKEDPRKCNRAKKILKRAQGKLNKANKQVRKTKKQVRRSSKQTRKSKKQALKKAKTERKNAKKALTRAQARVKRAC